MTAVLEVRSASRVFGEGASEVTALQDADLQLSAGELVAIMGPSGSGKSTLLTIAGGLDWPTSGRVILGGTDLGELGAGALAEIRRRKVGFVFQELNLLSGLTAAENVAIPLELDGAKGSAARSQALAQLDAVGLGAKLDSFPDDLSGGERQRVAIARALVGDRHVVLADEPTGSVDSETGEVIMTLLRSACQRGAGVVVVTHDPGVASHAERTLFMRDGCISSEQFPRSAGGPPEALVP